MARKIQNRRPASHEGYDETKKGYQPSTNPRPQHPPQSGTGVVPGPRPKPVDQQSKPAGPK